MGMSEQLKSDLRNPWLRGILGVVGVTVSVNLVFIIYAFWSPPDLVAKDYYERGKNYFHEKIKRENIENTSWRMQILAPDHPRLNQPQTYRVYIMNHAGQAIHSGQVILFAYRPSGAESDFKQQFKMVDNGTFAGTLTFPLLGKWDLIAQVRSGDQKYDVAQRINVAK